MKKLLLLVAAAMMTLGATASTPQVAIQAKKAPGSSKVLELRQNIVEKNFDATNLFTRETNVQAGALRAKAATAFVTPEGTPKPYILNDKYYSNVPVSVSMSDDGTKVFFSNLFPYVFADEEAWAQANVSEDGKTITFPIDLPIAELTTSSGTTYSVYPVEMLTDEAGFVKSFQELVLVKDGDRYYIDDDFEHPTRYIGLVPKGENGEYIGHFDSTQKLAFEPYEGNVDLVELPEGAEPTVCDYYYFLSTEGTYTGKQGLIYTDGNDVYMNMLAAGMEAWVKGTKEGNTVTFKGGQYLGKGEYYFYFQPFFADGTLDEEGYLIPQPGDYKMIYDPETGKYTAYSDDVKYYFVGVYISTGQLYQYAYNYVVEPFAGFKPAIPADAHDLQISDMYYAYYGAYLFFYTIDPLDVNGKTLNPEFLSYYIYVDDEIYNFTHDVYTKLTEDMTLIPYGFSEDWDFWDGYTYLYENLFETVGVQTVYTVDGVTNYSNVVSVDLEGNTYTMPAPQDIDGLENMNVKEVTSVEFYDAQGRKLDGAQPGVNVVKMIASDGSVKTVKMYKK
ncbi:MAG: hypothetical protein J5543_04830 [Bacteroidales bacterium]|nr:hypothetical protein [Bacteroidales bacterium]